MRRGVLFASGMAVFLALAGRWQAPPSADAQSPASGATQTLVAATTAFLNSLSAEERQKVQFTFTPQKTATAAKFIGGRGGLLNFVGEQYGQAMWSNFPVSSVPRTGIRLGNMSDAQRTASGRLAPAIRMKFFTA